MPEKPNRFASWSTEDIAKRLRMVHGIGYENTDLLHAAADRLEAASHPGAAPPVSPVPASAPDADPLSAAVREAAVLVGGDPDRVHINRRINDTPPASADEGPETMPFKSDENGIVADKAIPKGKQVEFLESKYQALLREKEAWFRACEPHDVAMAKSINDKALAEAIDNIRHLAPAACHWALNVAADRLRALAAHAPERKQ